MVVYLDRSLSVSVEHLSGAKPDKSDKSLLPNPYTIYDEPSKFLEYIQRMTCTSPIRHQHRNLTVLDVYDEAALIGKDFERIIEGNDVL